MENSEIAVTARGPGGKRRLITVRLSWLDEEGSTKKVPLILWNRLDGKMFNEEEAFTVRRRRSV